MSTFPTRSAHGRHLRHDHCGPQRGPACGQPRRGALGPGAGRLAAWWRVAAAALGVAVSACATPRPPEDAATTGATAAAAPLADLPAARRVPTRLGEIAVRDVGAGPLTLVLWPSILADTTIYTEQIRAWRARHRLIVVDGPGHGASGSAPAPFSMADCATALAQVLDALGVTQPVVVVGTSWGGLVAGEFALAHPQRTAGVVMLNAPLLKDDDPSFSDRFVTWGARWLHGTRLYSDGVARAFFLPRTRERGGPVLERFHAHLAGADGAALALSVRSVLIDRVALAPRLRNIDAPTLFVAGSQDQMYPMATLRAAAAALPRGQFVEVPSGHISVVDAPDQTTRLIDEFLAGLRG